MSKFTQEEKTNIVLENILNRKSVRYYLEGKKIPDAKIQILLKKVKQKIFFSICASEPNNKYIV